VGEMCDSGWIGTCIGTLFLLGIGVYFLFQMDASAAMWYAFKYDVNVGQVHIAPKPTDCNFWHAPVGFKDCHYEKWVARYGSVYVSWVKKSD
jgi:hypothetical protein